MNCFICVEEYTNNNKKVIVECCQQHICTTCINKLDQCPFCNKTIFIEDEERRDEIEERRIYIEIESENLLFRRS
eukprot:Pgem_evm1s10034